MKKIGRFLLLSFSFLFICLLFSFGGKVEAKRNVLYQTNEVFKGCQREDVELENENANFWQIICSPYHIEPGKEDTLEKYTYSKGSYNFSFQYDYEIVFDVDEGGYIKDDKTPIFMFYGVNESTTITFMDIETDTQYDRPETFRVYKYRAGVSNDFELITNFSSNSSGSYSIDEPGIYKLETYIEKHGTDRVKYLVYETDFYYSGLREIVYDSNEGELSYKVELNTPSLFMCNSIHVTVNNSLLNQTSCSIEAGSNYGDYIVTIHAKVPANLSNVYNKTTYLSFNGANFSAYITYDSAKPVLPNPIVYYPKGMEIDEFAIYYNSGIHLPSNAVAVIEYSDDSAVRVSVNGKRCFENNGKVTCDISSSDGENLVYSLEDTYGNEYSFAHTDVEYNNIDAIDLELLRDGVAFEDNKVIFNELEEHSQLSKMCLIYGDDLESAVCSNATTTLIVNSDKYYSGKVMVILADEYMNTYSLEYNSVTLNNGYDETQYVYENIEGNTEYEHEITEEIKDLIEFACVGDVKCLETVEVHLKYGEKDEIINDSSEFTKLVLPTYLDMINGGFNTISCAFSRCDQEVEVYVSYLVGGVNQKLSAKYKYIDRLPQLDYSLDYYAPTRSYDFSTLNVNSISVQRELFVNPLEVNLTDGYNRQYLGVLKARIIQYTDRNGNVSTLNNTDYTYLSNNKNFGYYLLEGYIEIYQEEFMGKSFFISVELADKNPPVLEFIGSSRMELKQYDVFKDPEFKCNDGSGCTTSTKYYYQTLDNEVDKIDTAKSGTYYIKYIAVDGDDNVSELVRTVVVESVNAMNATSIIIIVSVVVLLVGFITIAIIVERKKSKEEE